jgi:hypothetical protein
LGNQSLFRKPSHTFDFGMGGGEKTYTQDGNDMFLPNLYMTYSKIILLSSRVSSWQAEVQQQTILPEVSLQN